ncbi:hypothetical protein [Paraburkholderia fungorum]|uniref:Uncharacterized protein n=1 Tax=Paraburkholderia fungorum TaxID=134537 RepID=A0AAW3UZ38_9BURK|nr:hypothetical protein [Paraburkholderia fungorum]MBB4515460.1 hypothetical protein [Paraburkholderia fungorum]MBB6203403.1 hypothetical protein [Paraburkholderia fungorum]USX07404.1 hypothetical protein NHH62_32945 [Paraburkholderia fungorum]
MMVDLLVKIAVAAAVLVMVILFVVAQDTRPNPRERILRHASDRRWWNRTRHGP